MPKNFLMIFDITSIAALIVALYMLFWDIAIIFKLRLVSWAAASRKNLCIKFRDIFNVVPKKFANFYLSLQLKNATVNLKFEWNMVPIY